MVVADGAERQLEHLRPTARTDALEGVRHSYYVRLTGPESSDTQGERGRLRCASCPYRAGRRLSRVTRGHPGTAAAGQGEAEGVRRRTK